MSSFFDLIDQYTGVVSTEATVNENEIEIYILTDKLDQVKEKAISRERQEQYGLYVEKNNRSASGCSMRVRETIAYGHGDEPTTSYEFTMKIRNDESGIQMETNLEADYDAMQRFKLVADSALIKMRYNVPAGLAVHEGAVFQVDVFEHKQEEPWVKVDLELPVDISVDPDTLKEALSALFPEYQDMVIVYPMDKCDGTPSAKLAKGIMDKHGSLKGPFNAE